MSQRKNNALSEQTKLNQSKQVDPRKQIKEDEEPKAENFFQNPTFMGMDYFRVIYAAACILGLLMIFVYLTVEDEKMRRMTLVQGGLSVFLILVTGWYHGKVEQKKADRLAKQARLKRN